ncbi:MAG: MFS transporter [Candidatus Dormibacteria bacterium]
MADTIVAEDAVSAADAHAALRELVPSARQVEAGEGGDYEFRPAIKEERVPGKPVVARVGEYLQDMRPRSITQGASMLPFVLFAYLQVIENLDGAAFQVLQPEIKKDFSYDYTYVLLIPNLVQILIQVMGPGIGFMIDRVKRVWLVRIGALLVHGSLFLTGTARTVGVLSLLRMTNGLGIGIYLPATSNLSADFYPVSSRGRMVSFTYAIGALGGFVGLTVVGLYADRFGWRPTLLIIGGLATVVSFSFFLLREPVRGYYDRKAMGAGEEVALREQRPATWSESWRACASIKTLRKAWIAAPLAALTSSTLPTYVNFYYQSRFGLGVAQRSFILGLTSLVAIFAVVGGGIMVDRMVKVKPSRIMAVACAVYCLQAASYFVMIHAPNVVIAVVAAQIPTLLTLMMIPIVIAMILLILPARIRGLGVTTTAPFAILGFIAAPLVFGPLADQFGLDAAFTAAIVVLAITGFIYLSAAGDVERDIRAAVAASMADEEATRARAEGRNKLLICRDVDVTYDGAQVLFNVDFDVEEGEIVALLGTNGAGKSTLLRAISGIQEASNGAIFFDGSDITHMPPHQNASQGIVMMPGGRAVFPSLTVAENLRAAAWLYKEDEDYVRTKTAEVLEIFPRLKERMGAAAGDMSGGEQQMLALSQALLMRPRLLMIDELSLGLAPQVVEQLLGILREIHAGGTTILIVEQSVNVALRIAQRAVYMEKGEIKFDGATSELRGRGDIIKSVFLGAATTSGNLGSAAVSKVMRPERVEDILAVRDLRISFGGVDVLNGVSLDLAAGEVVGLVGPNGAGKTTLFDVITGFARPSGGSIVFAGQDVTEVRPDERARMGIGRSYQNVRLFPALTVRETIAVALERHLENRSAIQAAVWSPITRRVEKRVARRVENLVGSMGLEQYADRFMNELSTGTRRIVDIACLLAASPQLLLLDEPTSGLAQAETELLGPVIGRIVKETGCGLLIIEHDIGLVSSVSDRMIALRLGQVMAEGTPGEVLDNKEVIDALLGGASEAVIARTQAVTATGGTKEEIRL